MTISRIPLIGYAPDLDPSTPGVFSYCKGMESTTRGWKLIRGIDLDSYTSVNLAANSYVLDGFTGNLVDGTFVRVLGVYDAAAAAYKLYRATASSGVGGLGNKSRAANYSTGIDGFSYCMYGNYVLATNLTDVLQIVDASTTNLFADSVATGIPKAKLCCTWGPPSSPRVMLLHYNDGTLYVDGWWTSHQGGPTAAWTPDIATGAANGRLLGAGPIRCAVAFQDSIVVFGDRQMWLGQFVGPPAVVQWTRITDEIGCVGKDAAKVVNGTLYFVGDQGLYQWAGSGIPQLTQFPIQTEIRDTLAGLGTSKKLAALASDGTGQRLQVVLRQNCYGVTSSISKWYLINLLNGRVGLSGTTNLPFQLVLDRKINVYSAATAVAGGYLATYVETPAVPYSATVGEQFGFGLNYLGAEKGDTKLQTVMPRFMVAPSSYQFTDYYGPTMNAVSSTTTPQTVSASPWRADCLLTARYHAPRFYLANAAAVDVEIVDVSIESVMAGNE